ncbi:ABC transporter ATP-binding protein [Fibrobacterales bacterium]|nr:ABC transporter ATP-binding protein [Fibrobacterales bacterium]
MKNNVLLKLNKLSVKFKVERGNLLAVKELSLEINEGQSLGLVGESGSGKSVGMLSWLGLLTSTEMTMSGEAIFCGQNVLDKNFQAKNILGSEIGVVFQNPLSSLNPFMKIGAQVVEGVKIREKLSRKQAEKLAISLLERVGIEDAAKRIYDYPHEFSGGMRQRVLIAMALAGKPKMLVCDEPTASLDVTTARQVLDLLETIRKEENLALILISHDFNEVLNYCERVAVLEKGSLVEEGPSWSVLDTPLHPVTRNLLASVPGHNIPTESGKYFWDEWKKRKFKGWQLGQNLGHRVNLDVGGTRG